MCGRQELKAQDAAGPVGQVTRIGQVDVIPDTGFDAGAGMYQGITLAGVNPPAAGDWPCFGGGGSAQCSSIPSGGLVIPFPLQVIAAKSFGEVVWTFSTTSATGTAGFTVKITQGTATIFSYSFNFPVTANGVWCADVVNAKLSGAKKGTATVTVTTTVGAATITGKTVLHIQ